MQNLNFRSFFHTNTTALAHGLLEGQMAPTSSISWICALLHHNSRWNASIMFFEWCGVIQFDRMFNNGGFA